jgi:predicted proteasome-type protease
VATVGEDTTYVGADVVAQYYKRNLRIFANIEDVAEPGDRILVIFGAGHLPYLRPLIEASPQMEFVDPLDYL